MARNPKNPELVQCLNYGVCQTMVLTAQRGREHKYGVYDSKEDKIVYKTCPGS